ncbi:MAG: Asp23/Gls24 family envelope stress response protein [Christensenellaceae bacterium]|jgi:uncharacterized alkaline shock family protein YloU|nr:Asp23/Gls24 family envelope stress response protein [Christensenellaceae bacterium]
MALYTSNIYGDITISDEVVLMATNHIALDVYGVVDLASRRLSDSILDMFNRSSHVKGVKVETNGNRIYLDVYAIVKESINKEAVKANLESEIRYRIERLTGMRVKSLDVHIVGIRL